MERSDSDGLEGAEQRSLQRQAVVDPRRRRGPLERCARGRDAAGGGASRDSGSQQAAYDGHVSQCLSWPVQQLRDSTRDLGLKVGDLRRELGSRVGNLAVDLFELTRCALELAPRIAGLLFEPTELVPRPLQGCLDLRAQRGFEFNPDLASKLVAERCGGHLAECLIRSAAMSAARSDTKLASEHSAIARSKR